MHGLKKSPPISIKLLGLSLFCIVLSIFKFSIIVLAFFENIIGKVGQLERVLLTFFLDISRHIGRLVQLSKVY